MPGAIELKKGVENLPNASRGSVLFGVDSSGNPITKDENGVMTASATLDGSPVLYDEQVSDPSTGAGEIKVYAKRVTGTLGLYQRTESDGAVTAVGSGGGGGGADVYPFTGPPLNAAWIGTAPTTGTGNVICPGPSAGFVRKVQLGFTGAVVGYNLTGGVVDLDYFIGGNRIGQDTGVADGGFSILQFTVYLSAGEDLTVDFISGGGGSGVRYNVFYQDIPTSVITAVNVVIGTSPTVIVPPAATGKVHVLDATNPSGGHNLYAWNDSGGAVTIDWLLGAGNVEPQGSINSLSDSTSLVLSLGAAVDETTNLSAVAGTASAIRVISAYREIDLS